MTTASVGKIVVLHDALSMVVPPGVSRLIIETCTLLLMMSAAMMWMLKGEVHPGADGVA